MPVRRLMPALIVALCVSVTSSYAGKGGNGKGGGKPPKDDPPPPTAANHRIGAFNLQTFGPTKASDPEVMQAFAEIIRRYDAILVQEIRDISESAPHELLAKVNDYEGPQYGLLLSPRLGRTAYKEQYGLYYQLDRVTVLSSYTFEDPADVFEREPHIFYVDLQGETLGLIGLHAKPADAVAEIDALDGVYRDFKSTTGDKDAILLGDLNADCGYASDAALQATRVCSNLRTYSWLIPDSADTTTSSTHCAYDRIVVAGRLAKRVNRPAVFLHDEVLGVPSDVSDHYAVELEVGADADDFSGLPCAP